MVIIVKTFVKNPEMLALLCPNIRFLIIMGNCEIRRTIPDMKPSLPIKTTISMIKRFAIENNTPVKADAGIILPLIMNTAGDLVALMSINVTMK